MSAASLAQYAGSLLVVALPVRRVGDYLARVLLHLGGELRVDAPDLGRGCEQPFKEGWPGLEFSYITDGGVLPAKTTDMAALDAEVRRELRLPSCETAMRAYLEVRDTSARLSNVFIEVLMPARITELDLDGTVLTVEVIAAKSLDARRCFLTKRASDGLAVLEHREVMLRAAGERDDFVVQRGSIELEADGNELMEIVLTHSALPELDEVRRRVHDLLPLADV
jgi:hypothetical protein